MRRIRIHLAYDGGPFHGWQVQPGLDTIQGILERIVSDMEGKPVHVAGSGRTDAGVHALEQVAAFSIENPIPPLNLKRAINRLLPPAIRVLQAVETDPGFHPRFDAIAKTYEYRIARGEICSPFEWPYVHHHPYPLNENRMMAMASIFEGEHDFTAFAASDVPVRERVIGSSLAHQASERAEAFLPLVLAQASISSAKQGSRRKRHRRRRRQFRVRFCLDDADGHNSAIG